MAVGETSGQAGHAAASPPAAAAAGRRSPTRPSRRDASRTSRRRPLVDGAVEATAEPTSPRPRSTRRRCRRRPAAPPAEPDELERQLTEDEEIERRTPRAPRDAALPQGGRTDMLMPRKVKHRKQQRGRLHRQRQGRHVECPSATSGSRPSSRLDHRPPDRGRPYRHDPPRQARRQGLDPGLPGQARHPEAGRDPHGLGQGQPRALGRRGQARPHPLRAGRRRRGAGPRRHGAGHPEAADQGPLRGPSRDARARRRWRSDGQDRARTCRARRRRLLERLGESRRELFNLRFQLATGQLDNPSRISAGRARWLAC